MDNPSNNSLIPTTAFLAAANYQIQAAQENGIRRSDLNDLQQRIVSARFENLQQEIVKMIEFLESPQMINVINAEINKNYVYVAKKPCGHVVEVWEADGTQEARSKISDLEVQGFKVTKVNSENLLISSNCQCVN